MLQLFWENDLLSLCYWQCIFRHQPPSQKNTSPFRIIAFFREFIPHFFKFITESVRC
uniref:Uncharacterized protein n=1 Tax=Podoviridae sp. ctuQh21 TaxID=2825284 RepID=A0A8S5PGT3_9CAUD|nr:MAG TPA: hypothetical protein [Podoviridae sp. ctuQh21]